MRPTAKPPSQKKTSAPLATFVLFSKKKYFLQKATYTIQLKQQSIFMHLQKE